MSNVSVNSVVNGIMAAYDHNQNGEIDLKRQGFFKREETTRSENSAWSDDDSINLSTTSFSREKLFYAADGQGNRDGKVSRDELTAVVSSYDKNHDGQLDERGFFGRLFSGFKKPEGELNVFNREYGERSYTNTTSISTKPNIPVYNDPFSNSKPITSDPFSNSKPITSDPFSNSKPITSDPFSNSKPSNSKPITSDPFSNNKPSGSVTSDPFSKPSSHSGSVTSDPFSKSTSSGSVTSDPFSKK